MKNKIVDLHCDMISHFTIAQDEGETNIFKKYHLDNFKKGNMFLSVFNIWIDEYDNQEQRALEMLKHGAKEILNNKDVLNHVYNYDDIVDDKVNFIIGLEGIDYLKQADDIYAMYQYGVRLIGLTWNHSNVFAASITNEDDYGLSDEGRKAIKIMNELGILVDISHVSDKAANEILEISKDPVIASHSNVRSLCKQPRNLTDEFIIKVAKSGGVIGMNSYPEFVSENKEDKGIEGLIKHIDYIKDLVGVEYIAFGFDFMDFLPDDSTDDFVEETPFMEELMNHSEINNLINALQDKGYTQEEIDMITHKNSLRVIKNVLR